MARAGRSMAALAFVAVGLSALIPIIGTIIIGPLAALIIGAGAGWWASKLLGSGGAGRGAGAGAIAGLGAFLGAVVGTVVLFSIFGNNPEFQQQFQEGLNEAQQQNPDAQIPALKPSTIASLGGGVLGFCIGLFNIFLSMIGGLIAGLAYGRRDTPVAVAPAGGYIPESTSLPQMTSQAPYNPQPDYGTQQDYNTRVLDPQPLDPQSTEGDDEHKARIYPDNDGR